MARTFYMYLWKLKETMTFLTIFGFFIFSIFLFVFLHRLFFWAARNGAEIGAEMGERDALRRFP